MGAEPSPHDWQDCNYVEEWARGVQARGPWRERFFAVMAGAVSALGSQLAVIELGSGPGFLAEAILERASVRAYWLVDVSPHMHDLARARLRRWVDRVTEVERDFTTDGWAAGLPKQVDAVIALQSVHELRDAIRIPGLYGAAHGLLRSGGLIVVGDLVNHDHEVRGHLLTVEQHLGALQDVGFGDAQVLLDLGPLAVWQAQRS